MSREQSDLPQSVHIPAIYKRLRSEGALPGLLLLLLLSLVACGNTPAVGSSAPAGSEPSLASATIPPTLEPMDTATPTPSPPLATAEPTPQENVPAGDLSIRPEDVQLFPVPKLVSGDRVTFMVQPYVPESITVETVAVEISVDGQLVSASNLGRRNWAGNAQGIFEWVWDTSGRPGYHEVQVVLDSQDLIKEGDEDATNNETTFTVRVGKAGERPLEERDASWITGETDCCYVHAITRTAAYRDFPELLSLVDSAVSEVASRLNEFPADKIDIYFIDRMIAQGGYASTDLALVYNDRRYIGGELYELVKHEAAHVIDRQFAPQRIPFLAEGVAVWAAGGHYRAQDLQQRAAALLAINGYVPLAELANNFYPSQHESGYLEAGAFVDFLVERYGWAEVREFYSNTSASDGATQAEALDANLRQAFGASLSTLEDEWLAQLREREVGEEEMLDLRYSIRYHETARRYQRLYDATAYFRTAWLPHPGDVITRGNAADFLRRPEEEANVVSEIMLLAASEAIEGQEYERAGVLLDSIDRFLNQAGSTADPLVNNYQKIVHTALSFGYDPQQVTINGGSARVLATTASGHTLHNLDLELRRGDWIMLSN